MTKTRFMALTAQFYQLFRLGKNPLADNVLPQKPTSLLRRRGLISMGIFLAFIFSSFLVLPTNAWADDENTERAHQINKFIRENLAKSDSETERVRTLSGNMTVDNLGETGYLGFRVELQNANSGTITLETYKNALMNEVTNMGTQLTKTLLPKLETYGCDYNGDWATAGAQKLLNIGGTDHKMYSWTWHVNSILDTCTSTVPEDLFHEITNFGQDLDNRRAVYQTVAKYLKKEVNGEIIGPQIFQYQFCKKYDDNKKCVDWGYFDFLFIEEDGVIESLSGASQGCVPLPFKLYEAKSCLFCPLFDIIFKAINQASAEAYSKLGRPLSTLTAIGLAIWIAFMVLQNVSAMTKQDALEFLTKLFQASFKVIIAIVLLRYGTIVYDWIIGPILKTGFEFGTAFLDRGQKAMEGCADSLATINAPSLVRSGSRIFPDYVYKNLMCFIKAVQMELAASQAIGSSLMCISRNQGLSNLSAFARVLPDFSMMLQGFLIYIISFIMSIAFGFYLIDATIQLGIFGVLLPFLILCWPFKLTNKYFNTGVGVFMNSWFVYVFMGIVINIDIQLIGNSLTGGKGGFGAVENAINSNNVRELQELLSIGFAGFLVLIACCIFSIKLLMKVEDLAGQFSGGGLNLGIGSQVGGLAASGATNLAKQGLQTGKNIASGAYHAKVWKGSDGKFRGLDDAASWAGNKFKQGAGNVGRSVTFPIRHPQQTYRKAKNAIGAMFGSGRRGSSE